LTLHAILGLAVFNVILSLVGVPMLAAVRPSLDRKGLLRLTGFAYMLGLSTLMVALSLCIVVGIPVTMATTVLVVATALVVGTWMASRRRRGTSAGFDAFGGHRYRLLTVASAIPLAALIVVIESIFRRGRLEGLLEFDGWDSWGPITKDLYFSGHLQPHFLSSLPGGSYPPGLPAVLASAFHAMGSADVVTVHLQYWFMAVGFAIALIGLLGDRVSPGILMPFVFLIFVMPDIRGRSIDMYGDLPLGYLVATSAVLVLLWVRDGERWSLVLSTLTSAAAILTKREGIVLIGCIMVAAALSSWKQRRSTWPQLGSSFVVACSGYVIWAIWLRAHHLHGNGPESGLHFITDIRRGWDSFDVVTRNVFNFDLWLLGTTLAVAAIGLALLAGVRRSAIYLLSFLVLTTAGSTLILWSTTSLLLTDISVVSRLIGTTAISAAALTPLLLQDVLDGWQSSGGAWPTPRLPWAGRSLRVAIGAMVVAAAIAYPATVVAKGWPHFPRPSDCSPPPIRAGRVLVVIGYATSYPAATSLQQVAAQGGFHAAIEQDGCGRLRVVLPGSLSRRAAETAVRKASASGLRPTLVAAPSP
jgi:hypothetical protein